MIPTPPTTAAAREPEAWRALADEATATARRCRHMGMHVGTKEHEEAVTQLAAALRAAAERIERLEAVGQAARDIAEYDLSQNDRVQFHAQFRNVGHRATMATQWQERMRAALAVARDGAGA